MPAKSDINEIIEDPTATLTKADIDPIGSAAKEPKKAWDGLAKKAATRTGEDTYREDQIRGRALELAIDSLRNTDFISQDEAVLARAKVFEKQLRGEEQTDGDATS